MNHKIKKIDTIFLSVTIMFFVSACLPVTATKEPRIEQLKKAFEQKILKMLWL